MLVRRILSKICAGRDRERDCRNIRGTCVAPHRRSIRLGAYLRLRSATALGYPVGAPGALRARRGRGPPGMKIAIRQKHQPDADISTLVPGRVKYILPKRISVQTPLHVSSVEKRLLLQSSSCDASTPGSNVSRHSIEPRYVPFLANFSQQGPKFGFGLSREIGFCSSYPGQQQCQSGPLDILRALRKPGVLHEHTNPEWNIAEVFRYLQGKRY